MKVNSSQYYIINDCMFHISYRTASGIAAKKVWEWNQEAILNVEGLDKAIRVPKAIIKRLAILEREFHD